MMFDCYLYSMKSLCPPHISTHFSSFFFHQMVDSWVQPSPKWGKNKRSVQVAKHAQYLISIHFNIVRCHYHISTYCNSTISWHLRCLKISTHCSVPSHYTSRVHLVMQWNSASEEKVVWNAMQPTILFIFFHTFKHEFPRRDGKEQRIPLSIDIAKLVGTLI